MAMAVAFPSTGRCGLAAPAATTYRSVGRGPRGGAAPPRERRRRALDDCAVGDDAGLGDADDPVSNEVAVAVLVPQAGGVHDPDPAPDAGVLVDDGVLDHALGADAHGGAAAGPGRFDLLQRLELVGAQHQGVLQPRARVFL